VIRRPDLFSAVLLVGLSVALWIPRFRGPIDLRFDGWVYYILGTSLAEGKGYRLLNEPGEIADIQYPPLLPAVVAVHQRLLGSRDPDVVGPWLRASYFVLNTVYLLAVYAMARRFLAAGAAALVALITAIYLFTFYLSDVLYTEVPYALATVLLVLGNRAARTVRGFVLAAAAVTAAYLLRTAGIALMAAWVAEGLIRRDWRQAAARAVVVLVPVVGWQSYIGRVKSSAEYLRPAYPYQRAAYQYYNVSYVENILLVDPFMPERGRVTGTMLAQRVARNLAALPLGLGEAVSATRRTWTNLGLKVYRAAGAHRRPYRVARVGIGLLSGLIVAGAGLLLVRREWLIPLVLAATVALICLIPWTEQIARYLTPVTPLLALALILPLEALRDWGRGLRPGWRRWAAEAPVVVVVAAVVAAQTYELFHSYKTLFDPAAIERERAFPSRGRPFYVTQEWADLDRAIDWLRREGEPGAVIAALSPQQAYLQTGLKAVMPPMESDAETEQRLLDSVPIRYVIIDDIAYPGFVRRYALPAIENHPDLWRRVYTAPASATWIYERVSPSPTSTPRGAVGSDVAG
jgi:hypothetical protein